MSDVVDRSTRSRMMKAIKSRDTYPEVTLRRYLHAQGYRFRLHRKDLPGTPDIVLPRLNTAIFVHGCFWHRHQGCFYASTPKSRSNFWEAKFDANIRRDRKACEELKRLGWRVLVIWECGFKHCHEHLSDISELIHSVDQYQEWPIRPPRIRPA